MSSSNSYTYYNRFLRCLDRYLEKIINERKKDAYVTKAETLYCSVDPNKNGVALSKGKIYASFKYIFDQLIDKAPSACMGADDWLDKFLCSVVYKGFCTETWCENDHCEKNSNRYPYNCSEGCLPSKCKIWKAWRLVWRSYPDNEVCQKCKHYKPEPNIDPRYRTDLQTKQINEYKCYCRKKELPEDCPKRGKTEKK